jgi:hypothetical protein
MLYEMLTGTRPQGAFDLPSIKSNVDARLDAVVIKAMREMLDSWRIIDKQTDLAMPAGGVPMAMPSQAVMFSA